MTSTYIGLVKAAYDYTATSDDELTIEEGKVYYLLDNSDADWSKVKARDEEHPPSGLAPSAYFETVEPISYAKAQYDYDASGDGELTIKEEEELLVFEKDDDWWLVKSNSPHGRLGLVPGNYLEEATTPPGEHESPPSVSAYLDPQERVAQSLDKPRNDGIETWSVSEIDKKGKKKKGTLGIGNGAVFFASESDKTPVRQWPSTSVTIGHADKPKHIMLDVGNESLHISTGSKDTAEAIVAKLGSSRAAAAPASVVDSTEEASHVSPPTKSKAVKVKKSVNFSSSPAEVIGSRDSDEDADSASSTEVDGIILYDFAADGDDELAVSEGEHVVILDRESSEDWWKVRNKRGHEGVVPALYVKDAAPSDARRAREVEEAVHQGEREEAERRRIREETERDRAVAAEEARKRVTERRAAEEERLKKVQRELERQRLEEVEKEKAERAKADAIKKREPNSKPSKDKTRMWHDRTRQFRVEAEYLGMNGGKLRLHKTNGVIIEVPVEKMSPADITYVEDLEKRKRAASPAEDKIPLAQLAQTTRSSSTLKPTATAQKPKAPNVDWFKFFLDAGCDSDDCTRYASAFEKDKIDEIILPDLEPSTLRTLGLREGDVIRVTKHIKQKFARSDDVAKAKEDAVQEQIRKDEELARRLQAQGDVPTPQRTSSTSPAPNLFASANGALKNQRRGRRTLEPKASSSAVDVAAIETATAQMRVGTPQARVRSPEAVTPDPPVRKSTTPTNGFEDDAWAPRPSSTVGIKSNTPAPVAPTPPQAQPPPEAVALPNPPAIQPVQRASTTSPSNSSPQFDLLAQIRQMRPPSAPASATPPTIQPSPAPLGPIVSSASYGAGLGVGSSPSPIGHLLTAQQTGVLPPPQPLNGPRGPFAPVPQNQSLLAPLIPTNSNTGSTFIPARPIQSQPTGFPQTSLLAPQVTGAPVNFQQPLLNQPTGFNNSFGGFGATSPNVGPSLGNPSGVQNGLSCLYLEVVLFHCYSSR
ncbi:uncharacterized protein EI90DRAFT_3054038 [Cantharellus anzutake]|uniref:uncharacterized protein n=1 Tax=Cantharellus anzutake TaxID=1750568 RepID=UPI0019063062|nr:uncharacterized protein EI90DRAFT_3054038 [Cantharellus anzutake]KAF8332687.1 hypothetical protein EI90DRAFT_3054038 [Cantharellus anzutake]